MMCDNEFCIYWHKTGCVLENISLDIQGAYKDCIYISIDNNVLKEKRKFQRKKFDNL